MLQSPLLLPKSKEETGYRQMFLTNLWPDRIFGTPWATRHDSGAVAYSHPCGVVFYTEGKLKLFSSKSRSVCHPKTWFQLCCQPFCYRVGQRARFGVAYHCLCCCFVYPFCLCPCMAHRNIGSNLFFVRLTCCRACVHVSPAGLGSAVRSDKRGLKVFQALLLILRVLDTTVKHGWTMWNFSAPKSMGPRSQDVSSAIIPSRTLILTSIIFS